MSLNITVLGAGGMGTAMAVLLCGNGHSVTLWDRKPALLDEIRKTGANSRYLDGIAVQQEIMLETDDFKALKAADMVVFAVPSQAFPDVFARLANSIEKDAVCVNVAKGIEQKSLKRLSEIAADIRPELKYVLLSGPSHAEEIGLGMPTTVTAASSDIEAAEAVRTAFSNDFFRVYVNEDLLGAELGGALKNVIALACGVSDGLGYADNSKAALMTRGIAEMKRLGLAMGADGNSFAGLTGIGDLIVTCTSMHSRNRRCGIFIGQGLSPTEAIEKVGAVVEGAFAAKAASELAAKYKVDMPITTALERILESRISPADAAKELLAKSSARETEDTETK